MPMVQAATAVAKSEGTAPPALEEGMRRGVGMERMERRQRRERRRGSPLGRNLLVVSRAGPLVG